MAQRDWWCLCSARMQVPSPAWQKELKDPGLPQLQRRSQLLAAGISSLTQELHMPWGSQKEKKRIRPTPP